MPAPELAISEIERSLQCFRQMPAPGAIMLLEEEIENRVYVIYGLPEEEIKIVEGK